MDYANNPWKLSSKVIGFPVLLYIVLGLCGDFSPAFYVNQCMIHSIDGHQENSFIHAATTGKELNKNE